MTEEMNNQENEANETHEKAEGVFDDFVNKQKIAAEEFTKALEELFPPSFREHTRKAGQAFVESFKVLVDSTFQDLEEFVNSKTKSHEDEPETEAANGKVRVDVE